MSKIGIVLDNYKLEKYEQELQANDFKTYTITPFIKNCTTIQIETEMHRAHELQKLCQRLEFEFQHKN